MGTHIGWKTKEQYVIRYRNGESQTELFRELKKKKLTKSKLKHSSIIFQWDAQYDKWAEKVRKNKNLKPIL